MLSEIDGGADRMNSEKKDRGIVEIDEKECKGCGLCVSSCRSGALNLKGFETGQIMAMINEM